MRVTPPVEITASHLSYASVAEPSAGEVTYNGATSYLVGDVVISTSTHKQYTSLQGATATVTLTVATPCVCTWVAHGLESGAPVVFTTAGTLPTGVVSGTTYYALKTGVDTFNLAATAGGAAINTTGTSSGVHTGKSNLNIGHALPVDPETQTDWWIESGVSNRYAMFDLARSTKTVSASPLIYTFAPGQRVDFFGALGMEDVSEITVTATSGGNEVYNVTQDLVRRRVMDGRDYCFEEFSTAPSFVVFDMPLYTDIIITATFTSTQPTLSVGSMVVGASAYIGEAEERAEVDADNFSRITRTEFGGISELVPRRSVTKTRQTLLVSKDRVAKLLDLRTMLNAVPAVWCGIDDGLDGYFEPLLILGIYKRFSISLAHPDHAIITLELEEI